MTNKEFEDMLIKVMKLKEGAKNVTLNNFENAAFNNNLKTTGVLEYARDWANTRTLEEAVEKVIEDKSLNFVVKDFVIVSFLNYKLRLMGKVKVYRFAEKQGAPKVLYFANMQYVAGFVVKCNFVYPMVQQGDQISNKGQKSLKVRTNPHYKYLKALTYQYEVHLLH